MNQKFKIIATLLMSFFILGFGITYLYKQFVPGSGLQNIIFIGYDDVEKQIVPPVTLPERKSSYSSNFARESSESTLPGLLNESKKGGLSAINSGAKNTNNRFGISNPYSYSNEKEHETFDFNAGSPMMLAFNGRSLSSGSNTPSENSPSVANTSIISSPMSVPFVENTQQALIDPGARESNLQKIAPVGEGWWILLLLASVYFLYRKR